MLGRSQFHSILLYNGYLTKHLVLHHKMSPRKRQTDSYWSVTAKLDKVDLMVDLCLRLYVNISKAVDKTLSVYAKQLEFGALSVKK